MKTPDELKALHGAAYVEAFARVSPARIRRLLPRMRLAPGDRVVDFACGDGLLMEQVAPRVRSYVGVDFSAPFIAAANRRRVRLGIENAEFVCAEIGDFCARHAASFDAAFAMDFSEHVYDPDWLRILGHIHASLRPGGRFYLHTPNAEFFVERMKQRGFILRQFPEHVAVRSPRENRALLEQAGFRVVRLQLLAHYNALRWLHPLSFLPLLGPLFKARIFIEATRD